MKKVWNYVSGPEADRHLLTGQHTIKEIYCAKCEVNIGWTYVRAYEQTQEYKIGKFILEKAYIKKVSEKAIVKIKKSNKPREEQVSEEKNCK